MEELYKKSTQMLELYLKTTKIIPSEKEWNYYAKEENLASSKSLEYYNKIKFNKMCRKLIKIKNRENKNKK